MPTWTWHAALVRRLRALPEVTRIVVEPTGGYEKALVKALRQAKLPVEIIHTTRFKAYRELVGAKAKSDTSDARLLAAYAAAPDEVRGRHGCGRERSWFRSGARREQRQ